MLSDSTSPDGSQDPLLEVVGLRSDYGPVRAIHQADLHIRAGEADIHGFAIGR